MRQIDKYAELKLYMPFNGYETMEELANDWECTVDGIRNYCRGKYKSARLDKLTSQFIKEGDKKLQEYRRANLQHS